MFHYSIKTFKSVSSTNTLLVAAAKKSAQEGLVYTADHQTRGRGKLGNVWISPPGANLLFSVLFRPPIKSHRAPIMTQIACRSIAKVLKDHYKISSTFKRPNDILVRGKKLCGVLTEAFSKASGNLEGLVVGVGLNVNSDLKDLPTASISMKTVIGRRVGRKVLLRRILNQLRKDSHVLYDRTS